MKIQLLIIRPSPFKRDGPMGPIFHPISHFLMEWAMAGRGEKWMEMGGIFFEMGGMGNP